MVREQCWGCEKRKKAVKWTKATDYRPFCGRCAAPYVVGRDKGIIDGEEQFRRIINAAPTPSSMEAQNVGTELKTKDERRAYRMGHEAGIRAVKTAIRDWLDVHSKRGVEDLLDLRMR